MIKVRYSNDRITIRGHSGYAPPGQDIVCAAISALSQTFEMSLEKLTEDTITSRFRPGEAEIVFGDLSEAGRLLLDSFLIGITGVAEAYPDHVKIDRGSQ